MRIISALFVVAYFSALPIYPLPAILLIILEVILLQIFWLCFKLYKENTR